MRNVRLATFVALLAGIFLTSAGICQSDRTIGILPFRNEGASRYEWMGYGIDQILYTKLAEISSLTVYEKQTLKTILSQSGIDPAGEIDPRKAFSIGKATGIEVLILGNYRIENTQLAMQVRMVSTYTGASILEESYSGSPDEVFAFLEKAVRKGFEIMQISLSPAEEDILRKKPTRSISAFESYCKAFLEIEHDSPLEVIAGYFHQALQEDPEFWEAQYNLGNLYYERRSYEKALQQFNSVIEKNRTFYKAYYGRGVIYYLGKEYPKSLEEFRKTLELNPEHDRSHYYLGILYTRTDSLKKGIQSLEKSIEINPNYAPAHYQKGLAEMKRGWFKAAITSLSKATDLDADYYQAHNALGEAYYALNLFEEAIIEFRKVIKLKPTFATAHFNLGNAIYRRGALAEIVDAFWSLLEVQYVPQGSNGPTSIPLSTPLQGLEDLREKSRIQDPQEIYRTMIGAYRTALQYDERFYEASYNLALTYENLSQPDSAEYFYKKAIAQKPDLSQAHMRLGKLYDSQGKYEPALEEFKIVVKIEPDYFAANPKLGEPYRYIDVVQAVLNEAIEKLKNDPQDKDALATVGKIYLSLGRFGQAEEYYQQLVDLSPNDAIAQQTLREIRRKLRKL